MVDKKMFISKEDKQNYNFFRVQFVVETLGHSILQKSSKLLSQRISYYKTLGTSAINIPMSPPSLAWNVSFMLTKDNVILNIL